MKLKQESVNGVCVCRLDGSLDTKSADDLRTKLHKAAETCNGPFVVDLTKVGFVASVGLSALISFRKQVVDKGGKLALCGLSIPIHKLFKISYLDKLFQITASEAEALTAVKA